jgi:peptidoglycan/LPS O-acetylase OafA/YrhL
MLMKNLVAQALDTPNRIFGLDVLRALAIFITVFGHAALLVPAPLRSWHNVWVTPIDGVNIFFVLSGYLIGGILFKALVDEHRPFSLRYFWMRRWLRTIPAYLVVLTLALLLSVWSQQPLPRELARYFWFGQNLLAPHPEFFAEGWSLAVEEWFYLLFPVVILVMAAAGLGPRRALLLTIALFLVLPPAFKLYQYQQGLGLNAAQWDTFYRRIVAARLDAIAVGVLARYAHLHYAEWWHRCRRPGLGLAAGLLLVTFLYPKLGAHELFYNVWLRPVLECAVVVLVLPYSAHLKTSRLSPALTRAVLLLSVLSYSMYLLNETVLIKLMLLPLERAVLQPWLGTYGWLVAYALYWGLLGGGALLLHHFVEQPFMRLRNVFEPSPTPAPAAAPQPRALHQPATAPPPAVTHQPA